MNSETITTKIQNVSNFRSGGKKTKPLVKAELPAKTDLQDTFILEHKKNGLFERLYNFIKNKTKLGIGSDKVEAEIKKTENGEATEEQALETIDKYRKSQENAEQMIGDAISIGTSGLVFFKMRPFFKKWNAVAKIDPKTMEEKFGGTNWFAKLIKKTLSSKGRAMALILAAAGLAGGISKDLSLKINRIGSKKYSTNKADFNNLQNIEDELDYKDECSFKFKMKVKDTFRNLGSGALNGIMLPITTLIGGFVGVPLYLAANSLNRYFIGNSTDGQESDKSFNNYVEGLKNDSLLHATLAAGMAVPLVKKGHWASVFDKNLKEVVSNLMGKTLKESSFSGERTYKKLERILTESNEIKNIVNLENPELYRGNKYFDELVNKEMSFSFGLSKDDAEKKVAASFQGKLRDYLEFDKNFSSTQANQQIKKEMNSIYSKQIEKLSEENLFSIKMMQINEEGDLANALQENCPKTRTLEEAANIIKSTFGDKYEVRKCLGVGTIAETYLVKAKDGKEYCIKMLKVGIDKDKIAKDKDKCIDIIKNLGKPIAEEDLLIRNIEDLAKKLEEEINFTNEMENAKKLAKHTKEADVVKGVEVKDNLYVMEKANGISLRTLTELNRLKSSEKFAEKNNYTGWLESLRADIEELKNKMPDFDDITSLTEKESTKILEDYDKILIEQYNKLNMEGKTIHGDIHPGNIFIDLKALRSGKGKIFTLIDTGNTIDLTKEQTKRALQFTSFTKKADIPDIVEYVLDGAIYPAGMTKEQAKILITEDLKKLFFDYETKLKPINNDSLSAITSNIMGSYGIIPGDTALALNKAKTAANKSLRKLMNTLFSKKEEDLDINSKGDMTKAIADELTTLLKLMFRHNQRIKVQERLNLAKMSPSEKRAYKNNPNLLKENSKEFLTYDLKQKLYRDDIPGKAG